MRLSHYDITIRVADPDDEETYVEATIRSGVREDLLKQPIVGNLVGVFEESIEEN